MEVTRGPDEEEGRLMSVPTAACGLVDRRTADFVLGSLWVRLIGIYLGYSNGTTRRYFCNAVKKQKSFLHIVNVRLSGIRARRRPFW